MATKAKYAEFEKVYGEAERAGFAAGEFAKPVPMVVAEHASPVNDSSPIKKMWHVPDGVCGFAWVKVRPGTSSFARWLVKTGRARPDYYGGVSISVSAHNQSMERKEAHAAAMAKVLSEKLGINCYADSRMD